jgi:hypothetical protein
MPIDYETLKALAAELRRPLRSLIVLKGDNDPFLANRPGRRLTGARWFAGLWDRLDVPDGVHLRRLHYLLVSTASVALPDGSPYENTDRCWKYLGSAACDARYLDLVPAATFRDRRAPEPIVFFPVDSGGNAILEVDDNGPLVERAGEPLIILEPHEYRFPELPNVSFSAPEIAEPFAIEVWVEKSTINDILLPLAQTYGVTLVTGLGELSLTQCLALVGRVRAHQRPTRILYISDHDPAGDGMPVSVARKIEFLTQDDDLDIKLFPLLLTAAQVAEFDLPRVPIKDSDARRGKFQERHGEGGVELDALEALHPGALGRIVRDAILLYRNPTRTARREIAELETQVLREIDGIRQDVLAAYAAEITEVHESFDLAQAAIAQHQHAIVGVIAAARGEIAAHQGAIDALLDVCCEQASPVWDRIASDIEDRLPDIDAIEWPEPEPPDEPEPLFDSSRDYLDQVAAYKRHQGAA